MFKELEGKELDYFIIDLRHNTGGNSAVIKPLIDGLKSFKKKSPDTWIYVVIGRKTYSSGLMAAIDITSALPATLIGEPTGGSPNSFGELQTKELPNSRLPISYSVKYFKLTDGASKTIEPDIYISPTIEDYKANNDVVLNRIFEEKQ
jgi:C-terminal processing protease CtpA/Prc